MGSLFKCSSLEDIISYGNELEISHDKLFLKNRLNSGDDSILINFESLMTKYYDFIMKEVVEVTLSDDEYLKYRYKPKLLSFEMYGILEFWSGILSINEMISVVEFDRKTIKLFNKNIINVINEILILESDTIKENLVNTTI